MQAIILAAGMGTRLGDAAGGRPKCMIEVAGRPLIDRMIERIGEAGIDGIIVVTGYEANTLKNHVQSIDHPLAQNATFVHNSRYSDWGNFYSLLVAKEACGGDSFIKLDGDVLLDPKILPRLVKAKGPAVLAVDCKDGMGDEEMKVKVNDEGNIIELNKKMDPKRSIGEFIGVDRVDAELAPTVFSALSKLVDSGESHEYYERAYERLIIGGQQWHYVDVSDCTWTEIDDARDLAHAHDLAD